MMEAILVIFPFVLTSLLLLEVIRREIFELTLKHLACIQVRDRALGVKPREIETSAKEFLDSAFGKTLAESLWTQLQVKLIRIGDPAELKWLDIRKSPGGMSELWLRYEQLITFRNHRGRKHHQEVLTRCLFPFS